ncbi:MAG: hypothetical protein K0S39_2881 [Paenibacillus sp.]|nr:hypothetical protein [Paenibacillus sp.]
MQKRQKKLLIGAVLNKLPFHLQQVETGIAFIRLTLAILVFAVVSCVFVFFLLCIFLFLTLLLPLFPFFRLLYHLADSICVGLPCFLQLFQLFLVQLPLFFCLFIFVLFYLLVHLHLLSKPGVDGFFLILLLLALCFLRVPAALIPSLLLSTAIAASGYLGDKHKTD